MYSILQKLESIEQIISVNYRGSIRRTASLTSLPLLREKEDEDAQLVDADEFMKFNAQWWKNSPNETRVVMTPGGLLRLPTNYMTLYTLEEVGNDRNIVELNQHCISIQGQPSTIQGEDTRLDRNDTNLTDLTVQRGYIVFLLPVEKAWNFFNTFENHMMSIEFVDLDENKFKLETNDLWRISLKTNPSNGTKNNERIWLTCNIEHGGDHVSFPTNNPNRPGQMTEMSSNLNQRCFQFNNYIFCELHKFACITIITSEVGLDDDEIDKRVTLPDFIQLAQNKQKLSLPQQVIKHINGFMNEPTNY